MPDAKVPTKNDDGVTTAFYFEQSTAPFAGTFSEGRNLTDVLLPEAFYYALGNPQRTLRPNYDRRTEYPNLP